MAYREQASKVKCLEGLDGKTRNRDIIRKLEFMLK